jgi:hypothetical protein
MMQSELIRSPARALAAVATIAFGGCGPPAPQPAVSAPTPSAQPSVEIAGAARPIAGTVSEPCDDPVLVVENGRESATLCPADAEARKLTIVDLRDAWTPSLFAPQGGGPPEFRARYLELAAEHDTSSAHSVSDDSLRELYGVLPSLAIVRARLADDPRHFCHAFIDSDPIALLDKPYSQDDKNQVRYADQLRAALEVQLERERARRDLPDLAALAAVPALAPIHARWKKLADLRAGIVAAQNHYVCEGFLTEAAARQIGWLGPAETRAFLTRHPGGVRVAIALPPPPAYHSPHMDLTAEIDRGDVWYDPAPIPRHIAHRPTLVVYVNDGGTRRPLIRWPTTIGGWADQRTGWGVVQRWKESEVGPRVWRDLYAAPTWLPPPTTPDRDLVKYLYNGHYALKSEVLGPGPHAAYGMTLLVHHQIIKRRDGSERFDDNGIGTHGSASVTSVVNGTSHGCHRLYNQLAVRLVDFLLRHREHIVRGEQSTRYRRVVSYRERFVADIRTRGFLYELTPPVPITVLPGNIRSDRKIPPRASAPARPD